MKSDYLGMTNIILFLILSLKLPDYSKYSDADNSLISKSQVSLQYL